MCLCEYTGARGMCLGANPAPCGKTAPRCPEHGRTRRGDSDEPPFLCRSQGSHDNLFGRHGLRALERSRLPTLVRKTTLPDSSSKAAFPPKFGGSARDPEDMPPREHRRRCETNAPPDPSVPERQLCISSEQDPRFRPPDVVPPVGAYTHASSIGQRTATRGETSKNIFSGPWYKCDG